MRRGWEVCGIDSFSAYYDTRLKHDRAAILRAEATSESMKLVAEGKQAYLNMLKETVGPDAAAKVLIAQKTLDAYRQATGDPAAKVFLPLSALPNVLTGESAK